jgi:hypothetical protein
MHLHYAVHILSKTESYLVMIRGRNGAYSFFLTLGELLDLMSTVHHLLTVGGSIAGLVAANLVLGKTCPPKWLVKASGRVHLDLSVLLLGASLIILRHHPLRIPSGSC